MQERQPGQGSGLTVRKKQLVFALPVDNDDREEMRYFTEETDLDASVGDDGVREALSVIGAWSDLDWDEAVEELDRIRHESRPTPPIDDLERPTIGPAGSGMAGGAGRPTRAVLPLLLCLP